MSDSDIRKNNFLVLGEGSTHDINGSVGAAEQKFDINFSKAKTKFCMSWNFNGDYSYIFVDRKEICKFKAGIKNLIFPSNFFIGSISELFSKNEYIEYMKYL